MENDNDPVPVEVEAPIKTETEVEVKTETEVEVKTEDPEQAVAFTEIPQKFIEALQNEITEQLTLDKNGLKEKLTKMEQQFGDAELTKNQLTLNINKLKREFDLSGVEKANLMDRFNQLKDKYDLVVRSDSVFFKAGYKVVDSRPF